MSPENRHEPLAKDEVRISTKACITITHPNHGPCLFLIIDIGDLKRGVVKYGLPGGVVQLDHNILLLWKRMYGIPDACIKQNGDLKIGPLTKSQALALSAQFIPPEVLTANVLREIAEELGPDEMNQITTQTAGAIHTDPYNGLNDSDIQFYGPHIQYQQMVPNTINGTKRRIIYFQQATITDQSTLENYVLNNARIYDPKISSIASALMLLPISSVHSLATPRTGIDTIPTPLTINIVGHKLAPCPVYITDLVAQIPNHQGVAV